MTVSEAYQNLKNELHKIYDLKESANISQLVIEKITGFTNTSKIINKDSILTEEQVDKLFSYTQKLMNHQPVQYVLNEAWFSGLKFYVDKNVLIPRPETEELVAWIIQEVSGFPVSDNITSNSFGSNEVVSFDDPRIKILDVGTGSGCIAIALKKKINNVDLFALDVSEQALKVAALNAKSNNADITFFKTDILSPHTKPDLPLFDVIVSNPPYISKSESLEMHSNILLYEPHIALFVPDEDSLLFYNAICDYALTHLNQNGKLFLEINENQFNNIIKLLREKGFQLVEIKKDMQQKNRMIKATRIVV